MVNNSAPAFALSIGIDLGTSNSALAVVTANDVAPRPVPITQLDSASATVAADLLPSFLYHPRPDEHASLGPAPIPGHFARRAASRTPGRVTHAAKSWLCHRLVDRTRPILPWGSAEVPEAERLSPVAASAQLLRQLWASAAPYLPASAGASEWADIPIILTVPASFAPDAQELTLTAAREAGLPGHVRLLEEPQAVFYDWLSRHGASGFAPFLARRDASEGFHLLVIDLGGGTSDFSLFTARPAPVDAPASELRAPESSATLPYLERIAVGEHLLLGGDNIDATIARLLEQKLALPPDPRTWPALVAAARDAKEALLSRAPEDPTPHPVAITLPGGKLFAATRSLTLDPAEIRALVLEGFFPECPADATPSRPSGGLRELGLPYAADSAITRHLAAFLRGHRVDAVLYNGGTLAPPFLRERLTRLLSTWQGHPVRELDNPRPDQAVALGAAWFGAQLRRGSPLIASHAAHAFWIETGTTGTPEKAAGNHSGTTGPAPGLLCLLPHGTPLDVSVRVAPRGLLARVNQPIAFRLYSSARPDHEQAGELRPAGPEHTALPELTAILQIPPGAPRPSNGVLPVALEATINAVGLLRVRCLPLHPCPGYPEAWNLHFPLRSSAAPESVAATVSVAALAPALAAIEAVFVPIKASASSADAGGDRELAPRNLFPTLEQILSAPRAEWTPEVLRGLWPALAATITRRQRSPEHEATWLSLAGYLLRPGCGWPLDDARLNDLWRVRETGLAFPRDPRVQTQEWILWRRVAGGLDASRQAALWKRWENPFRAADVPPELIRAAATLERLPQETRRQLVRRLLERLPRLVSMQSGQLEAWLWALGRLCSRRSLSGDPAAVLPPDILPELLKTFAALKFGAHAPAACAALAQAFRRTGERTLDALPEEQSAVIALLTRWPATEAQRDRVREVIADDEAADLQALAGERLPPGLVFPRKA